MLERDAQVISVSVRAMTSDTSVVGPGQMTDVMTYEPVVNNRRPGRTGDRPRALHFGFGGIRVASGLSSVRANI